MYKDIMNVENKAKIKHTLKPTFMMFFTLGSKSKVYIKNLFNMMARNDF